MPRLVVIAPDGTDLAVHTWAPAGDGGGEPVLLVHGLASNLRLWDGVGPLLAAAGHPVAALDLRGHGTSAKPDAGYDFPTLCADLAAVLDGTGWDRVVVVGQSMGAELALELAWRHPPRVLAVVCIDGGWFDLQERFPTWGACVAALQPPQTTGRRLAEIESQLRRRHPDWPEAGIAGALACFEHRPDGTVAPWLTRDRHLSLLRALWERRPATRYPEVAAPVLLVPAGDGSVPFPQRDLVEAAARLLPRAQLRWLAGDHDLHAQHPEAVAALIHQWLATAGAAPPASGGQEAAPAFPADHQIVAEGP